MGLINGALQIGKSGITVAQAALTVTGNNMANAATPSYSRQKAYLAPTQFTEVIPGRYTGTGVTLYDIRRQVDEALNGRIRVAAGDAQSQLVQQQALSRVEAAFNELTEQDLSSRLNNFFGAWTALQSKPNDSAQRNIVIQEGRNLTNFVRELRTELRSIQTDLDEQVRYQVEQASALADEVAAMNEAIVTSEAGRSGSSSALRDQRDELLKQLNELINIHTVEMEGGAVTVYVGSDPLIQYSDSRGLSYREVTDANGNRQAQVVFADNDMTTELSSGKIHGLITARDDQLGGVIGDLDAWTRALILEVNTQHSLGRGTSGYTSVTGLYAVEDADGALSDMTATGLDWAATNGVFYINVTDTNGQISTHQISVDVGMDGADMTLNQLVAAINAQVPANVQASVDGAGRLHIEATSGYTFTFSGPENSADATNVLAVLGVNSFFEGEDGVDFDIRTGLTSEFVVAGNSTEPLDGRGDVAGRIGALATTKLTSLNGLSLTDQFNVMVGEIATNAKAAQDNYTSADVVLQTLEAERQSISGVSTDEEAIHMITFQRAFQGSARFVSLINEMLDEVMSLV
ncbi:MAG: flagellar hook-associated protein FlgK [Sedimentisphaerales bacterium]|nr:flagellar hook-associated protein FlgK [Sedimentisphaerales bacterium]